VDFGVAIGADYIKLGGLTQKVRQIKYERLLAIEAELFR
jgi:enolase